MKDSSLNPADPWGTQNRHARIVRIRNDLSGRTFALIHEDRFGNRSPQVLLNPGSIVEWPLNQYEVQGKWYVHLSASIPFPSTFAFRVEWRV